MGKQGSRKNEIDQMRDYKVSKSNDIIRETRFEMSVQEQKTVAYIISKIRPAAADHSDGYQLEYEFDVREYCRICGLDYNSGGNYASVKATLKKLRDRSMWMQLPDGSEVLVGWLEKVRISQKSGVAKIKIDEDLAPYLFDLQRRFTEYQLVEILGMKSAYSIRLFELFRSYQFQREKTFELEELKHFLMVDQLKSYARYPDFRRFVLEPAIAEINELTYSHVEYETITRGRKVLKIKFRITQKKDIHERIETMKAQSAAIDGKPEA